MSRDLKNGFFCTGADVIIDAVASNNSKLTHAYLDTFPLDDDQVERLAHAINNSTNLIYLNLFGCRLDEKKAAILLSALNKNTTLQEIIIDHDFISDVTYQKIMCAVHKNLPSTQNNAP